MNLVDAVAGVYMQRATAETTQQKHKTSWNDTDIGGDPFLPAPEATVSEQPPRRAPTTWANLSSKMFDAPTARPARRKRTWANDEKPVPRAPAQPQEHFDELVPGCDDDGDDASDAVCTLWPLGDAHEFLAWD